MFSSTHESPQFIQLMDVDEGRLNKNWGNINGQLSCPNELHTKHIRNPNTTNNLYVAFHILKSQVHYVVILCDHATMKRTIACGATIKRIGCKRRLTIIFTGAIYQARKVSQSEGGTETFE